MKIRAKLTIILLAITAGVIALVAVLFYIQFRHALNDRVYMQLSAIMNLKRIQIEESIHDRKKTVEQLAAEPESYHLRAEFDTVIMDMDTLLLSGTEKVLHFDDSHFVSGEVHVHDLTPVNPTGDIMLGFTTVTTAGKRLIAVAQVNEIQQILFERTGMGESGESYLVGKDFRMRSRSRFFPDSLPTSILVQTQGVRNTLQTGSGIGTFNDYRGIPVFSAHSMIAVEEINWIILSEIDRTEAYLPLKEVTENLLVIAILTLIGAFILSIIIARYVALPVQRTERILTQLSRGEQVRLDGGSRREDEIGKMFAALQQLIDNLEKTIAYADRIGSGDFTAPYELRSENDAMGHALLRMRDRLRAFQQQEEQLLRESKRSFLLGEEKERSRLSRDLHDGLGALLTLLKLRVEAVTLTPDKKSELSKLIDEVMMEVKRLSYNFTPTVLLDFGVGEALANLIRQLQPLVSMEIRFKNGLREPSGIPFEISVALYRIAQETLNNSIKYSKATTIRLSITEFEDHVSFYAQDDGTGFDADAKRSGTGLRNIEERVSLLDGIFSLTSDNSGTIVEIEIPLKHEGG